MHGIKYRNKYSIVEFHKLIFGLACIITNLGEKVSKEVVIMRVRMLII